MTKQELVERIEQSSRTKGPMKDLSVTRRKAVISAVLQGTIDEFESALNDGVDIRIRGLGTFKVEHRKRKLRNFSLGVSRVVDSTTIKYLPAKNIRDAVKGE